MTSHTEDEWTILNPTISSQTKMAEIVNEVPSRAEVPDRTNAKPATPTTKPNEDCTCEIKPTLVRKDSIESIEPEYRRPRRARGVPVPPPVDRRYSPSPNRYCPPPQPYMSFLISSSTQLLDNVGKEDGIFELPAPAIRNIYLSTYPFGDKDVKKWSWLFAAGIEDEFLVQGTRDVVTGVPSVERARQRGDGYLPLYDIGKHTIPSVYLSRALDTEVVPEDTTHSVRYLIVTEAHLRPDAVKLMVAESRKAAAMLIYYNVLNCDPVLFVGATVHQCKTVEPKKYKKVNSLEEAVSVREDGFVGIVC